MRPINQGRLAGSPLQPPLLLLSLPFHPLLSPPLLFPPLLSNSITSDPLPFPSFLSTPIPSPPLPSSLPFPSRPFLLLLCFHMSETLIPLMEDISCLCRSDRPPLSCAPQSSPRPTEWMIPTSTSTTKTLKSALVSVWRSRATEVC